MGHHDLLPPSPAAATGGSLFDVGGPAEEKSAPAAAEPEGVPLAGNDEVDLGAGGSLFDIDSFTLGAGTVPPDPGGDLALNKPVLVSSTESAAYPGSAAVDGSATTRWASAFSDPQLGPRYLPSMVTPM